jgi:hypothetical protein
MQSKLVIATLAAMSDITSAISTTSQESADAASTLIGYYQNCQVQIHDLTMNVETLLADQKTTLDFIFTGIDEGCPDLVAEVWLETPEDHVFTVAKASDMKVTISSADIVNGAQSHVFTTSKLSGEYFAHVTVSPAGFECAMALTEECQEKFVVYPCKAVLSNFTAIPAINTALGPADVYFGVNGIQHTLNWDVSDLWNCDLYADYKVDTYSGESSATGDLDW